MNARRIVCGVDETQSAREAARQAGVLAAPDGVVELVAVASDWGLGLHAASVMAPRDARRVLEELASELRHDGVAVTTRQLTGEAPAGLLSEAAEHADLLAVGRSSRAAVCTTVLGRTARELLQTARVPLLLATPAPRGRLFPDRILVAADGPGHPERAVRVAGVIASTHGSDVTLVRVSWSRGAKRAELAHAIAELNELGVEPVEIVIGGLPLRRILELARTERASLVVLGARDLSGRRALSSVSRRVADGAPCSVLIVHHAQVADEFPVVAAS